MYYLIYGFLYLFSLLPFFILYGIGDVVYVVLYHVFGYRKKIVLGNLNIAFPEKTEAEKNVIAKKFYRNLIDTFIESIKMLSMSAATFSKKCSMDMTVIDDLVAKGKSIQMHSGHQMNWEYGNWVVARHMSIPWIGIYQALSNKAVNRIFFDLRSRFGTRLVSTREFRTAMHQYFKSQYSIGLAADQNTSPDTGYWMYFFSKPVPFIMGPDKGALKNNTAVVFVNFVKKKRGHYHFEPTLVTENAATCEPGELTRQYRDFLEDCIRRQPDNYLWSHRRWRHEYNNRLEKLWIDNRPLPS